MQTRTEQILKFLAEIEKAKFIERKLYLSNGRKENDAEHMWHMAMFLLVFEKELGDINIAKTLKLILMHDLVEIYAGDTFAFDKEGHNGKQEREMEAAERLFGMLPDDLKKQFINLFNEFENCETKEAKVAVSIDKLQATFQNLCSNCKAWNEFGIKYEDIDNYIKNNMGHDKFIFELYQNVMEKVDKAIR